MSAAKKVRVRCPDCGGARTLAHDRRANCARGLVRCRPCAVAATVARNAAARAARPTVCVHCAARKVARPSGLCAPCYRVPGLKERYRSTHAANRRGAGQGVAAPPPPDAPTWAAPGSAQKIAVMERRAANGRSVAHPDDEKIVVESWLSRSSGRPSEFGEAG